MDKKNYVWYLLRARSDHYPQMDISKTKAQPIAFIIVLLGLRKCYLVKTYAV